MNKIVLFSLNFLFIVPIHGNNYSIIPENNQSRLVSMEEYSLHIPNDEYALDNNLIVDNVVIDDEQDYELHICDNVKPPKISQSMAFFTQIGCYTLIQYLALKEKIRRFFLTLKEFVNGYLSYIYS